MSLINKIKEFSKNNNLENIDFNQQCYHFANNIKKIPLCEYCNKNKVGFHNSIQGYNKYCSNDCFHNYMIGKVKVNLNFDEIKKMYVNNKLSLNKISEKLGHSSHVIKKELIKNGIHIRDKSKSAKNRFERDGTKKLRLRRIKEIEENKLNGNQLFPEYNKSSISIIEQYGKEYNYNFQHAENGGEYYIKELGYWVDGYDKEKNVIIEYDEKSHYNLDGTLKKRDIRRQREIEGFLGCKFIRIKEK